MAGTKEGAMRARATNLAKDPDYYRNIGIKGGSAIHTKPQGFALYRELAVEAGRKGGTISRRPKRVKEEN